MSRLTSRLSLFLWLLFGFNLWGCFGALFLLTRNVPTNAMLFIDGSLLMLGIFTTVVGIGVVTLSAMHRINVPVIPGALIALVGLTSSAGFAILLSLLYKCQVVRQCF